MNKKFTFMVAALLAAGGFSVNAANLLNKSTAATEVTSGKSYYVVFDDNGKLDASAFALGFANSSTDGNVDVLVREYNSGFAAGTATDANYLWKVTSKVENNQTYYSFYNEETECYLAFATGTINSPVLVKADAVDAKSNIWFTWDVAKTGDVLAGTYNGGDNSLKQGSNVLKLSAGKAELAIDASSTDDNIYLFEVAEQPASAATLNLTMAGDGFSFAPVNDKTPVDDENNIFSKPVKAFQVTKTEADEQTIPAGMYFATEWPEELNGLDAFGGGSKDSEDAREALSLFEQCTFIAVAPNQSYETSSVSANGLKLIEVAGSELVKYDQSEKEYATKGDAVYVGNASFTATVQNPEAEKAADYQYTLKVSDIRYEKEAGKEHAKTGVAIAVTKIAGTYYVTTDSQATAFKTVDSTVADPLSFVADEKMPSIYNIQFVSGEDKDAATSEYGKYLGVGIKNTNFEFVAQGEALVDLDAPQYRFVVSAVNTSDKSLTLTNWETGEALSVMLYEVKDGVYRIKGTTEKVQIANEDVVDASKYTQSDLKDMEITLTRVDAAPTAGFLVKEKDNNEPFKISFATTETSDERVYVAENLKTTTDETDLTLSDDAGDAIQVVFEPQLNPGGKFENNITTSKTSYIYKDEDGRKLTASAYMGTYYKYKLRVVGTENKYIEESGDTWKIGATGTTYIAKTNAEGSVSLMEKVGSTAESEKEVTVANNKINTNIKLGYLVPNSDNGTISKAVSLFLEAEELGLSLAAEPVHVSLENERGGFMNVNESNEGVIAIRTEAAEDLTFWLDTTDSKALIPSFYISKGGKFMYNSADSAKIGVPNKENAKYIVSVNSKDAAKAIFKAGELVDSETLKTTVDKKETTVKVKADQNKGILGGLKNFQYNIVKPNDTEDNYVIRSANDNRYLTSVNNVLAFISDKDNAMRVIVETQSAPTSNEGVSATEVKVVANEGSVVVKNAAGKNVVVSTILGQVVANEVLTSDNATINVPAGIVVVAVEGESFKVNVK